METMTFDAQAQALLDRGIVDDEARLRTILEAARPLEPVERSVLTLSRDVAPVAAAAAHIERHGRPVVLGHMTLGDLEAFVPIDTVELPDAPAYLAVDVDLGAESRNVRPEDALRDILETQRSPLTLDEGARVGPPAARGRSRTQPGFLDGRLPARRPTGARVLDKRRAAQSRLVLGTATPTPGSAPPPARAARLALVVDREAGPRGGGIGLRAGRGSAGHVAGRVVTSSPAARFTPGERSA